ncbi:MAG: hypothetical protein N2Z67_13440 [Acetobacteraceae bacterium]|nr:hypothetical protein [Acetobacteraceae bacterium]MDW8399247.1 hypothetical protein [Acetobacteraceae bacterium]
MRKVLVAALGALALAGCVHHDGPYHGAGYGHAAYGYGYGYAAPVRRPAFYQPVFVPPPPHYAGPAPGWWGRASWRDRYHHGRPLGWYRQD